MRFYFIFSNSFVLKLPVIAAVLLCMLFAPGLASQKLQPDPVQLEKLTRKNPDSAFLLIQHLIKKYQGNSDKRSLGICYQQLGMVLHYQGAYQQALPYFFKADQIFSAAHDDLLLARNYNRIGQVYSSARLTKEPLSKFNDALKIFRRLRDDDGMAETYSLLAKQYSKTRLYQTGLNYLGQALVIYQKNRDSSGIAKVYAATGATFEHQRRFAEALTNLNKALAINRAIQNVFPQIGILNNMGDVFRKTGDITKAIPITMQSKQLAIQLKNKRQLLNACNDLRESYDLLHNADSSYYYSEKASKLYREIFQEESSRQINILQTLFEVEHKNSEITQLKTEKRLTLITSGALILICLLAILLGYTIYSRQRLKSRDEKLILETQKSNMELELKNKVLEQHLLNEQLELKSKKLTTHTLNIIQKNQLLQELKKQLNAIIKNDKRDQRREIKQLVNLIDDDSNADKNWNDFRAVFESVHTDFFANAKKYADNLTPADMRLLALLKMNLSSADIATMIGISAESLRTAKYRLRQKLQIDEDENLLNFIQRL